MIDMDEDGVVSKEEITMLALMPSDKKARPAAIARLGLCKLRGNYESNGSAQPIRAIGTRDTRDPKQCASSFGQPHRS